MEKISHSLGKYTEKQPLSSTDFHQVNSWAKTGLFETQNLKNKKLRKK